MIEQPHFSLGEKIIDIAVVMQRTFNKLGLNSVPNTLRNAELYRKSMFPEYSKDADLMNYLKGKFVIDIGSGKTHLNPYSLINVVARGRTYSIYRH
jgi:hypothetical protein